MRGRVERAADATDNEIAALALEAWAVRRLQTFEDAERGLCFGRLDLETTPLTALRRPPLGARRRQRDARRQLAGAGRAAVLRRHAVGPAQRHAPSPLSHRGRRILDLSDETSATARAPSRAATSCSTSSSGAASRTCATSSRRSSRPVPADHARPEPPLVVQGGPGTGKTAVGLPPCLLPALRAPRARSGASSSSARTRPSWSTSRTCCPTLGEESVEQRAVGELVDGLDVTAQRSTGGRAAQGRPATRRRPRPCRRSSLRPAATELVARLEGEYVRVRRARGRRAARGGARRAGPDRARARAVPHGRPAPLLRGLRARASAASRGATSARSSARCA